MIGAFRNSGKAFSPDLSYREVLSWLHSLVGAKVQVIVARRAESQVAPVAILTGYLAIAAMQEAGAQIDDLLVGLTAENSGSEISSGFWLREKAFRDAQVFDDDSFQNRLQIMCDGLVIEIVGLE